MKEAHLPKQQVEETVFLIRRLVEIAIQSLQAEPELKLPGKPPAMITAANARTMLDLFIRGMTHAADTLRTQPQTRDMDWSERKKLLEVVAWEALTLAKLLVMEERVPGLTQGITLGKSEHKLLMQRGINDMLQRQLSPSSRTLHPAKARSSGSSDRGPHS